MKLALNIADTASEMFFFLHFWALNQFLESESEGLWSLDTQTTLEFDPMSQISVCYSYSICPTVRKNRIRFREMDSHNFFEKDNNEADFTAHPSATTSLGRISHVYSGICKACGFSFLNKVKNFINTVLYM